ncbi:MAG TPA: thioredoxin domain-containing protein [Candidatus Dormibacteraeota bacterium]|nr:thioredoxin domain-containing protein [Candidatus Dormibacteraeota bacterium]
MQRRNHSRQGFRGHWPAWIWKSAVAAAVLSIVVLGTTLRAEPRVAAPQVSPLVPTSDALETYGSSSAPITMVVFTDYQCPSCRVLYENTLRPMINDYVASGKVYLVHHFFPLPMHKYGYEAARWVDASARVGEFANAEAALYDNQDAWGASGDIAKYISAAMPASDFRKVETLMKGCSFSDQPGSCPLDQSINADQALGEQIPVRATPTYVIIYKGHRLPAASGAVSWPILKQFFDSLLSQ